MDTNIVLICGRLAAKPELRKFESGTKLLRMLVTVRSEAPRRRADVLPISVWIDQIPDDERDQDLDLMEAGNRLYIVGAAQRRFWDGGDGRRSRIEIVASHVWKEDNVPDGLEFMFNNVPDLAGAIAE